MLNMLASPLIVAYGGGANSTAMLIEMHRRSIRPDLILFADTGGELPDTYRHVDGVSAWCVARWNIPIHTVRNHPTDSLESEMLRNHSLPSIAYGFKTCSQKWKIRPQDRFLKTWQPAVDAWSANLKCTRAIGYDAGEERRAKADSDDRFQNWHPLIEWQIHREDCLTICRSEGFQPDKSACFFCPSMKKHEITRLAQTHPELAARAIAMEANANLTSIKGLGRSFAWRDFLRAEADQSRLFEDHSVPDVPCGCYD